MKFIRRWTSFQLLSSSIILDLQKINNFRKDVEYGDLKTG